MQEFKEHWVQIRTPEQFSIFYQCCQQVAEQAKSKMVPNMESKVDGLADFKKGYQIPELFLEVDNLWMTLSGAPSDLYGLAAFLEDPHFFGFEKMESNYVLYVENKKAVAAMQADLVELTET